MAIAEKVDAYLESEYPGASSTIYRDLSLNFKKVLEDSPLEPQERFLNLLSIAVALESKTMVALAKDVLNEIGTAPELIQEAAEIAGIMGMNNVYYKFKSFLPAEVAAADYPRAGLRMNSLAKSLNSKKDFEMMALSVSIINGCPVCVASHEKAVRHHDVSPDKVHDLARLAATAKGLASLKKALTL
ncbi:carboxymuconolactone decarboxylase family protein [Bdellovibrio sp. 22V]|uniref:carboxymuconolactone decarboxylase family protein n=1 Tax=Bdellovibrio TaxID=958 RepID=UPI0025435661|nr:carboxymuconolactone decarboxylase family protein [Bdellovibrio sp. 22V]WII73708.1 carboxymuconolactone decarboxylase family protein [Bdellovibrio sp. 22V]